MAPRVLLLALLGALALGASPAHAAPHWSEGNLAQEIYNVNCPSQFGGSPYYEYEEGHYLGQYVDDAVSSPKVGEVFDLHLVLTTLGNECAGTRPKLEIALPPGVSPAITAQTPIRCYLRSDSSQPFGQVSTAEGCPTTLRPGTTNHPSISAWLSLDPEPGSAAAPAWPMPQGSTIEIQVPVVSDRVMNGIGDSNGCVCVVASVQTVNGLSRPDDAFTFARSAPSAGAYIPLFVFAGPTPSGPSSPSGSGPTGPTTPGATGTAPAGTTTPGSATPSGGSGPATPKRAAIALPRSVSRRALTRGFTLKATNLRRGDRVTVTLKRGKTTLRRIRRTARRNTESLRVRVTSRSAKQRIRRATSVTLSYTVSRDGKTVRTQRRTVRVR